MRRAAAVAVLTLFASPALACGAGSGPAAKPVEPTKAQKAAADDDAMLKAGYVKLYTRCNGYMWIKPKDLPKPAQSPHAGV